MSTSNVSTARESERSRVIATIVAGFIADPVAGWCWVDSESYLTNMGRFENAYGGKAFLHGSAWTDSDFRGGALWLLCRRPAARCPRGTRPLPSG